VGMVFRSRRGEFCRLRVLIRAREVLRNLGVLVLLLGVAAVKPALFR
jgi:hypothetical protein